VKITIPGDTIAKKNSQRIVRLGKFPSIRPSAAYDKWDKAARQHLQTLRVLPVTKYPVRLHLFFFRSTRRKFDLSNMIEGVQDVLQKMEILEDDSMAHVVPVIEKREEGYGWALDRENPRVEIEILEV